MKKNIKVMTRRFFLAGLIILTASFESRLCAQTSARDIMTDIYKKYDSLNYVTFDVKYTYSTDTLLGDFTHEVMKGTYTMAGKKAKYSIGDIDFMQNDSFLIAVYNNDKFIMVSDPKSANAAGELPMRSVIDSLMQGYSKHYTISGSTALGTVIFNRADESAQFKKFLISYDPATNFLKSIQYDFEENTVTEPEDTTLAQRVSIRQKSLTIEFSNYRLDNFSADLYRENNYIWFEDGECKPVEKYRDYKIYYSRSPYRVYQQTQPTPSR